VEYLPCSLADMGVLQGTAAVAGPLVPRWNLSIESRLMGDPNHYVQNTPG